MKVRGIEGSKEEIDGIIKDYGFNYDEFFEIPKTLHIIWLIIPTIIYFATIIGIIGLNTQSSQLLLVLFIIAFGGGVWIDCSVHLRFKNGAISFIVAISLIILLCIGSGYLLPKDAINVIKGLQ